VGAGSCVGFGVEVSDELGIAGEPVVVLPEVRGAVWLASWPGLGIARPWFDRDNREALTFNLGALRPRVTFAEPQTGQDTRPRSC
jgi:hypothetical protein